MILTHFWLGFWELKHRSNWVLELELSPGCCPCPCSASINSLVCCWVPRASRALAEERQESGTGTDRRGWKRLKVGGFTESDDIWCNLRLESFEHFPRMATWNTDFMWRISQLSPVYWASPADCTLCLRGLRWLWWWNQPTVKVCALSTICSDPMKSQRKIPMLDPHVWWWISIFFFQFKAPETPHVSWWIPAKTSETIFHPAVCWWFRHTFSHRFLEISMVFPHKFLPVQNGDAKKKAPLPAFGAARPWTGQRPGAGELRGGAIYENGMGTRNHENIRPLIWELSQYDSFHETMIQYFIFIISMGDLQDPIKMEVR